MRIVDYLKLGALGIKAHKKGTFLVVVISGILYGVIIATALLIQGLDNSIMGQMLASTKGSALIISEINPEYCEKCSFESEVENMKENMQKYGGKAIEIGVTNDIDGKFYHIPDNLEIFNGEKSMAELPEDVVQVAIPFSKAMELGEYELNTQNSDTEYRLKAIKEVNAQNLHHIIQSKSGKRYYVAQILPDMVFAQDLSFLNIGQKKNPLDIILQDFRSGSSQNFILGWYQDETPQRKNDANQSYQAVLAIFDDLNNAYRYYKDKVNYCTSSDQNFNSCNKEYKYQTTAVTAETMENYEKLQSLWTNCRILVVVLLIVAISVMMSTYMRLIAKNEKIINLYKVMGAERHQIIIIFSIYLFLMSSLVALFSFILGFGMTTALNTAINVNLSQVFSLAFSQTISSVWLLAWNNVIWFVLASILLATIFTLVIEYKLFSKNATINRMQ